MAQGPIAMAEPNFMSLGDDQSDDLPRTFRREKEARAREARERAAQERAAAPSLPAGPDMRTDVRPDVRMAPTPQVLASANTRPMIEDIAYPSVVKRFDVPFVHLVRFFLKCVLAAIPALILLGVVLWLLGASLQFLFPSLVKMKILIGFGT